MSGLLTSRSRNRTRETSSTWSWASSPRVSKRELEMWKQRTASGESLFPWMRVNWDDPKWPAYVRDFWHRQNWGNNFLTEKGSIRSNINYWTGNGYYAGNWNVVHDAPVLLSGFDRPLGLATSQELLDMEHLMWAIGGTAIDRVRPGKPSLDLATAIGELRTGGLPRAIGKGFEQAYNLRDVFRASGDEYLNIQFGWAPLVRDFYSACEIVLNTRALLERHYKDINRLIRRSYTFDTVTTVNTDLTKSSDAYKFESWGAFAGTLLNNSAGLSTAKPIEITKTVVNTHFSGGFRFFYPEVDGALEDLARFEAEANALLGTRLDPEVLWNLQPWTWLADYFVTFGDMLGNLSAIVADGLVIQYAYLMQETKITKEVTLPEGICGRQSNGLWKSMSGPVVVTQTYHRKARTAASPFGFGLSPEDLTSNQWAILAALGISRV